MKKKIDPKGKEKKQTNRKKWYKAVCSLAAAVVVCTVYTLMLPALTLDEESAGDAGVTISESSVPASESPAAAESSPSDNGSESHSDTAADSSADSSPASTESGPAAAAPSADSAPSTNEPTTLPSQDGENHTAVTLPAEETNNGAITGSSESQDEITTPDTDDQEEIKDEESGSPAADSEEADNSGSSSDTDADAEEDDSEKSDDTADVETASDWETTIPDLSDCETWAEKLLAVAGSQLGYHESVLNFRVDNDGNHKGYTRYGEWYGNPYGDWCAMFVSFCLNYAGIDEKAIPQNANCADWVKNLKKMEIYEDADLYVPEAGDIVFFDQSDADRPNHVGIISEVTYGTKTVIRHITKDGSAVESGAINALKYINEATSDDASGDELQTEEVEVPVAESIRVIEGNSSDQVQYVNYDLSNEKILGYVSITNAKNVYEGVEEQKPGEEQKPEENKTVKEQEVSGYNITVNYGPEANIPETASLIVKELNSEDEAYAENYEQMVKALVMNAGVKDESELNISAAKLFDISFMDGETEIEPAAKVNVSIKCNENADLAVAENQVLNAVHVTNDDVVEILDVDTETDAEYNVQALSFEQASFSVTGVIVTSSDTEYIRASKNASFADGEAYIIYNGNNTLLYKDSLQNKSIKNVDSDTNNYINIKKSDTTVWHNENGKIYTVSGNSKKYLKINNNNNSNNASLSIIDTASDATSWNYDTSSKRLSYRNGYTTYFLRCQSGRNGVSWNITTNNSNVYLAQIQEMGLYTDKYKINIEDTVKENGCLIPSVTSNSSGTDKDTGVDYEIKENIEELTGTYTYKWFRSVDKGKTFVPVTRLKVSGDDYNIDENGLWINVALDSSLVEEDNVTYKVQLYDRNGNPVANSLSSVIESDNSDTYYKRLQNGSFENPACTDKGSYQPFVDGGGADIVWKTTASDNKIEIVSCDPNKKDGESTHQSLANEWHGMNHAAEGTQYAELNANLESSLYQDVLSVPGTTMNWQAAHAPRLRNGSTTYEGSDEMYVVIMSSKMAEALSQNQAQLLKVAKSIANGNYVVDGIDYSGAGSFYCYNNESKWKTNSGQYLVPDGQYSTRYFFVSASSASKDITVGNQLDNLWFGTDKPKPNDDRATIVLQKRIYGLSDELFDKDGYIADSKNITFSLTGDGIEGTIPGSGENIKWSKKVDTEGKIYYIAEILTKEVTIPANAKNYKFTAEETAYQLNNHQYVGTYVTVKTNNGTEVRSSNNYKVEDHDLQGGSTYTVTFTNTYIPYTPELPETGAPGTTLIYLLGAMLTTAPLTITFIKRRRQKKEEN